MRVQKSAVKDVSTLYLVATPIGNLLDMTFRSIEVLKEVDLILAEDTRVTKVLLSHFNINTKLSSYHKFNEEEKKAEIIELLNQGKNIALVSDAGLPGISDPGYLITKEALDNGFNVVSLPGATASLTALIASGLPTNNFYFHGFLNHKTTQKEKELELLKNRYETMIFYEASLRIKDTLEALYKVFGNRRIAIAREISKTYEEYIRGSLKEILDYDITLKGEFVIVVEGTKVESKVLELNELDVKDHFNYYLAKGLTEKEAMKEVARDRKVAKNVIYKEIKEL